ncbi:MAG: SagB/ThcOx family dehydrogenase [Candidatus Bathyarchaeia archaeon]|jgi:SagB-type dehydrogenase family enzyme
MRKTVGDDFQTETKYTRNKSLGGNLDWANKPEIYKSYPSGKNVQLPSQLQEATTCFTEVLRRRKSIRAFSTQPLSKVDLAFLLWASTGIQRVEHGYEFRTAPSAGALYPIETYIAANNVEDVESGIYHYSIKNHLLEEIKTGNFGDDLAHAALDQKMCATASVVFIWAAVVRRSKWKYAQRAYRYIYLDAGHIAENLALAATSITCGSCQVGAFFDDEINSIVGIDGTEESAICLSVIGHPK